LQRNLLNLSNRDRKRDEIYSPAFLNLFGCVNKVSARKWARLDLPLNIHRGGRCTWSVYMQVVKMEMEMEMEMIVTR
jgi:hypothetical protein